METAPIVTTINENPTNDVTQEIKSKIDFLIARRNELLESTLKIFQVINNEREIIDFLFNDRHGLYLADSEKSIKLKIDARFWSEAIAISEIKSVMSSKRKEEWSKQIDKRDFPEFNLENIYSSIMDQLSKRDIYFTEKVEAVFNKLSNKHSTNDSFGFGERFILNYVIDRYGYINHQGIDRLHDLRDVMFQILFNKQVKWHTTRRVIDLINSEESFGKWHEVDQGIWKIKLHKNGTAHVEIDNEMCTALNKVLARKYPNVIPFREKEKNVKSKKKVERNLNPLHPEIIEALTELFDKMKREENSTINLNSYYLESLSRESISALAEFLQDLGGEVSPDGKVLFNRNIRNEIKNFLVQRI